MKMGLIILVVMWATASFSQTYDWNSGGSYREQQDRQQWMGRQADLEQQRLDSERRETERQMDQLRQENESLRRQNDQNRWDNGRTY